MKFDTNKLTRLGILAAISVVLMYLIRVPMFLPYLEYDPADVSILLGTFMYGPVAGLLLTVVVSALQALTVSASSGVAGFVMHVVATGAWAMVCGFIYNCRRDWKGALLGVICGALAMTAVMVPMNLIITPLFNGMPVQAVLELLLPAIIPFNMVKAAINSTVAILVYRYLGHIFMKQTFSDKA